MNRPFLPYSRQDISEEDIHAVVETLRSDYLTQGPAIDQFENALAEICKVKYVVAVSSATAALHIACLALGIGKNDRVWTTPNTFVASANCALYCGAQIDFVDIDPETRNVDHKKYEEKLLDAKKNSKLPKLFIPVHFGGYSCAMREIHELSNASGVKVLEDASHALGASYAGKPVGASIYSEASILSFHPVKMVTTGEGGAVLTNNAELAKQIRLLRSHGITRQEDDFLQIAQGPWYYEQQQLGFNYRICDLQAALGLSQLKRLHAFVEKRQKLAKSYQELLQDLPLRLPKDDHFTRSSWHLFPIEILSSDAQIHRAQLFSFLREKNIGVNVHYMPVHRQPYYQNLGFRQGDFPRAEQYGDATISIPLHTKMTDDDQIFVVEHLRQGLQKIGLVRP